MELLNKLKVSRRFALRGALGGIGVAMWLPVLDAMCNNNGTAFAQGAPLPTSFGIWFWGNGHHPDAWTPTGTGNGDAWQLPQNLQDFAEVKDGMTLVTGLQMMDGVFKGHGWGVAYVLAGGDGLPCTVTSDIGGGGHEFETQNSTQYQPTLDQVIADAIHTNEPFKSFETGVIPFSGDVSMGTVGSNLAHRGKSKLDFLPPNRDPKKIFDTLFSVDLPTPPGGSTGVPSDIQFRTRRSVLDAVLQDANRLKTTLGAADSQRIDSHMEGIRALERRFPDPNGAGGTGGGGSTGGCVVPEAPPITLADMTAQSQAINRLLVAGLACNLTRVYSHMWSGPRSDSTYPTIQFDGAHHAFTHNDNGNPALRTVEKYIMSQYADLAKVMKATPMGAGTVLDNTLCYGISDVAEPGGHVMKDWSIVLMGHGGGKVPGNRHVRLPGRKVTELMLTMQQVMGMDVTSYGSWDKTSTTVPEILT